MESLQARWSRNKKQILILQVRPWWPAVSIAVLAGPLTLQQYYWLSQQNKQKDTKIDRSYTKNNYITKRLIHKKENKWIHK